MSKAAFHSFCASRDESGRRIGWKFPMLVTGCGRLFQRGYAEVEIVAEGLEDD